MLESCALHLPRKLSQFVIPPAFLLLLANVSSAAEDCNLESAEFFKQAWEQQVNRCLEDMRESRRLYMGLGGSPLHWAASFTSSPEVIRQLLAEGADVNQRIEGDTPLHRAALNNTETAVIAALLEAGADISSRDSENATPLHSAAYNNVEPMVIEMLIAAGADVNSRTDYGTTPLHWAALNNSEPEIVEALLEAGADPRLTTDGGETPWDHIQENEILKDTEAYRKLGQYR